MVIIFIIVCIYFTFYLFCGILCLDPSLGHWSWRCLLGCRFWVCRLFMLLPLLVSFAFLLFSSSVSLQHLHDFSAAVHPSLPPSVSPFSLVLFLLLWPLSALHSFSSLPYPAALPVAPVTSFPSSSPVGCRFFFSAFKVFPQPLLSSVLACQLRLCLQLFLRLSFSRPLFLFSVGSSTFSGSSLFFSGFFYSSFVFCHSFCRFCSLASSFFSVPAPLVSKVPPVFSLGSSTLASFTVVPSVTSLALASSMSFALFGGGSQAGTSNLNIVGFPCAPGAFFLLLISFHLGTATFFFYDLQVAPAFGECGLSLVFSEVVSLLVLYRFLRFRVAIFPCMLVWGCFLHRLCHILYEMEGSGASFTFPGPFEFKYGILFSYGGNMDSATLGKLVPNITIKKVISL